MNNFWVAFFLTVGLASSMPICARFEGTLSSKKGLHVNLSCSRHGGVLTDLTILPIVNGLAFQYLLSHEIFYNFMECGFVLLLSAIITWYCHCQWWPKQDSSFGLIMPNHEKSETNFWFWYKDIAGAGWAHVLFMTFELALIVLIVLTPMPPHADIQTGVLMAIYFSIATLQPRMAENQYNDKPLLYGKVVRDFIFEIVAIGAITTLKYFEVLGL
jgi:hypothetical protein